MPRPEAAGPAAKMRRSHRKSRNGCSECKRRHIRCDEGRPACTNCAIAERACSYPERAAAQKQQQQQATPSVLSYGDSPSGSWPAFSSAEAASAPASREPLAPSVPSSASPATTPGEAAAAAAAHWRAPDAAAAPRPPAASAPEPGNPTPPTLPSFHESFDSGLVASSQPAAFTAQHLVLFNHAATSMLDAIFTHGAVLDIAVRRSQDAPYLLDQMLALAALHRASSRPAHAPSLRHQAAELQNRAVAAFMRETAAHPGDDRFHCVPRFLFSATLSLHVLAETLAYHRGDFAAFIDRFVDCLDLHRGILAVIRPNWEFLASTEIAPLLKVQGRPRDDVPVGSETLPLTRLLAAAAARADLPDDELAACRTAVDRLQWSFDAFTDPEAPHAASAFAVTSGAGYVDVLRRRRPEALVVLAYYGVLVHRSRRFWVFEGGTGAYMVRAIAEHLGDGHWSEFLSWPLGVLEREKD